MAGSSTCGFLDVGQRFTDFVDFETKLKRFEEATFTKYVINDSRTIEKANRLIADPQNPYKEHLKYSRIHYICIHGGEYKTKSSGKRPNQRTVKNNCPSKFTVAGDRIGNCLVIRKSNLTHNHPIDKSKYLSYPQVRRLDKADEKFGKALLQMEVPSKVFKETIREVSGKQVTNQDLKNLRNKLKRVKPEGTRRTEASEPMEVVVEVESMDCESESAAATSVLLQSSMCEVANVLVLSSMPEQPPTMATEVVVQSSVPEGAVQVTNYETIISGPPTTAADVIVQSSTPEGAVQVTNYETIISGHPTMAADVVVQTSTPEGAVQVTNYNTMSQPPTTAGDVIVQSSVPEGAVQVTNYNTIIQPPTTAAAVVQSSRSERAMNYDTIMSGPPTTPARVVLLQSELLEGAEKVTNNDIAENKPQITVTDSNLTSSTNAKTDASSSWGVLDVGQKFTNFIDFKRTLKCFEEATFTKYVICDSRTVEKANRLIVDPQNPYKKHLKYSRVHYICKHGGEFKTKSSGKRPNQRSFKNNCPAKFTVVGDRKENCLVINKSNLTHNHPIEKSGYSKYPQVRKLDKVHELLVPSKVLKKTIRKASGKKPVNSQNLRSKLRSGKQRTAQVRQVRRSKEDTPAVPFGSMASESKSPTDYDIIESEPPTAATDAVLVQSSPMPKDAVKVKGYDFNQGIDHHQLLNSFRYSGFQATNLGLAVEEINKMIECKKQPLPETVCEINLNPIERERTNCTIFLGYTSNMISAGVRDSIRFLVQHNMVDCIVTSAGGIEEDFIKCLAPTYLGKFELDGRELRKKGINRIGNLVVPNDNYIKFEEFLMPILDKMLEEQQNDGTLWTPSRMIHRLGKEIDDPDSVYYWAYKNNIPVFSPALTDGSIGDMLYFHSYKKPGLVLDIIKDIQLINSQAVYAQNTGMIILGGGLIKHHICNANLMRNGANFSVYVNTANEFDGSDSGARPDEAISWGKIRMDATPVKVYGEASIIFPLLVAETFAREFHLNQSERTDTKQ